MSKIDINHKFCSYEVACKYAEKLKAAIDYICKVGKYKCEGVIGVSNIIGKSVKDYYYGKTGKVGKPPIIREVETDDDKIKELNYGVLGENGELGNVYNGWHLHVLIVSCPGETVRQKIKKYINKNWWDIPRLYPSGLDPNYLDEIIKNKELDKERKKEQEILEETQEKEPKKDNKKEKKKVYNSDCDTGYAEYIFKQSESLFFINVNYTVMTKKELKEYEKEIEEMLKKEVDFGEYISFDKKPSINLKKLHEERIRLNTLFHYGSFSCAEKSKEEQYYNEMLDYYKQFHEEHTRKFEEEKQKRRLKAIKQNVEKRKSENG